MSRQKCRDSLRELRLGEELVGPALGDELIVAAAFDDATVVDDEDAVGVADGGKTMSDDEAGAALHQTFEGFVDEPLALGIEGGGGFIEEQDLRWLLGICFWREAPETAVGADRRAGKRGLRC